jgi:RimJ/RimL family protein N-acetyltransferase
VATLAGEKLRETRVSLRGMTQLQTARMRLEPCCEAHFEGLHAMNRLPEVMRFIGGGGPETPEGTRAMIERVQARWADWGYSWWSFLAQDTGQVLGAGAIQHLRPEAGPVTDFDALRSQPLEIGWRLHPDFWGKGLASEAAQAMAAFAFDTLAAQELLAVRHPDNIDSQRVMERLGMRYRGLERWYGEPLATHAMSVQDWRKR